ncbi:transposase [Mesorhizobium sp. M0323]|uniref:transposase n=1 Tax=Mesorhizobium sp. M0323 TaxID=2956938 RepID=UPI0033351725
MAAEPDLAARQAILLSIPGVAEITAATLVIEMPEIGALDQSEAACPAGLAPQTPQSGQWTGRAFVHGGRAQIR